ncbi:MAG: type 1 glutamine amidotransferase, partial [Proteobacteria bacterium]|nr:type 1 glutamine amidotransferase [Pseudomonadota bacterium]
MKSLIITWTGFQDQEVVYPYYRLREEAANPADVVIMSNIIGRFHGIMGVNMDSHALTDDLKEPERCKHYLEKFDLLVLPGGVKALEKLRQEKHVIDFIHEWNARKKIIASTCHGAQLLISARVVAGRQVSAYYSIEDDLNNAGATYINAPVVIDGNLVSSPHYQWMGEW